MPTKPTIVEYLSKGIAAGLKEKVITDLTKKLVEDFEEQARDIVKKHVEKLVLGEVQHVESLMQMRDELHVSFSFKE